MNPAFPDLEHRVGSLAEGVLIFLKWDIWTGGIAFLVWSVVGGWMVLRGRLRQRRNERLRRRLFC